MSAVRLPSTGAPAGATGAPALHVDWTRCDGRGLCSELLAGIERDEWGYPLMSGGTELTLAARELDAARDAVALCPRQALSLRARLHP